MLGNNTGLSDGVYLATKLNDFIKKQSRRNGFLFLAGAAMGYFLETQIENIDSRLKAIEHEVEGLKYEED